jgi:DNA-binding protein
MGSPIYALHELEEELNWELYSIIELEGDAPLVIIGSRKPPLSYVTAILTHFNEGSDSVRIRARGQAIANMARVVGLLRDSFIRNLKIAGWKIEKDVIEVGGNGIKYLPSLELIIRKSLEGDAT